VISDQTNGDVEVLIAEDSPTQAARLCFLLEQNGYRVTQARNGREALELLEGNGPSLVISDIVMPELDGFGLCRAIRDDARWRHLPVMLVTTLTDTMDVIRGLECGADNFIRKPYEEKYLLSRVRYLLMNRSLRNDQRLQMGVEITLGNQRHFITSERQQILDLLISTYEQAVQINEDLRHREEDIGHANLVLSGLYGIAEGLNQARSEKEVLETALDRALALPGVRAGWIFVRDRDSFRLAATRGVPPMSECDCTCTRGLRSARNILDCERLPAGHAGIPLWLDHDTLGVMNLVGPSDGLFDEKELSVLHNVGNQVAVALDRTRLREGLEKLVEERAAKLELEAERSGELATRLTETLESIGDVFVTVDRDWRFTYVNKEAETLLGRPRFELLGKMLWDEFPQLEATSFGREYHRAIDENVPVQVEDYFEPLDAWLSVRAFPSPQGLTIYARDVTDQKDAEQRLLESEERYRLLFERNPHPTWVYDLETLAFLAVNESAIQHYGYSREEFLAMTIREIRPPEDVAKLLRTLDEEPETPAAKTYGVFNHRKKDGTVIQVEIASSEITFAGRRAGLVLAMDVTERRRLEQQFLRAQRMESIGTLAGGIAHDLNNLLLPISMGVSLLKKYDPDERSLRTLDNIERSARRGSELVKQVLSFARGIEGSRLAVHVRDIVREIHSIFESTFPKNLRMEVSVPDDLWWIDADPTQLNQVLLNLLVNARDAMPSGGTITITARNADIDEHYARMHRGTAAGQYVMLEVKDEGTGMPQDIVDRIFEPFFTTKEIGRGTGLGLSTVAAIVQSHGGYVNVYSELGKGTVFKVYLPAQKQGQAATPADAVTTELPRGSGETILVVDDETSILSITQATLEAFGYKVIVAEDGAQAVGLFALHRSTIAAVITDMMMPVLDGPALITALRRIAPDVRVIASSGLHDEGKTVRASQNGVRHFLQKPYSADVLLRMVANILRENNGA